MSRTQSPASSPNGALMTAEERFLRHKKELHQQLITGMDLGAIGTMNEEELRVEVRRAAEELCRQSADLLNLSERERLVNEVIDETFGLGPLEPLMRDPTITDILVNGPKTVYVERNGRLERSTCRSTTSGTCSRSSSGSSAGSAGGWTRPARWSTPGCPTAAASTRSFRRWPWTARCCRFAASAPGRS